MDGLLNDLGEHDARDLHCPFWIMYVLVAPTPSGAMVAALSSRSEFFSISISARTNGRVLSTSLRGGSASPNARCEVVQQSAVAR